MNGENTSGRMHDRRIQKNALAEPAEIAFSCSLILVFSRMSS